MTTLKSNNNRLTSALQESTANVDEWKRQLHTYKEENLRLKRDMDAMKPIASTGNGGELNEEMRIEIIKLKSHIITLEKDIHSRDQEFDMRLAKMSMKDKNNDQSVSVLSNGPKPIRQTVSNSNLYVFIAVQAVKRSVGQIFEILGRSVQCSTRIGEGVAGA